MKKLYLFQFFIVLVFVLSCFGAIVLVYRTTKFIEEKSSSSDFQKVISYVVTNTIENIENKDLETMYQKLNIDYDYDTSKNEILLEKFIDNTLQKSNYIFFYHQNEDYTFKIYNYETSKVITLEFKGDIKNMLNPDMRDVTVECFYENPNDSDEDTEKTTSEENIEETIIEKCNSEIQKLTDEEVNELIIEKYNLFENDFRKLKEEIKLVEQ